MICNLTPAATSAPDAPDDALKAAVQALARRGCVVYRRDYPAAYVVDGREMSAAQIVALVNETATTE